MDFPKTVAMLQSVSEPGGTVVTLTLDLAGTGTLPEATRVFLQDAVLSNLRSEARPSDARTALRKVGRRISDFVALGLQPGTKGLYLVAGKEIWLPLELQSRTRNFVTTGSRPFLPPLLAQAAGFPRGYLVTVSHRAVEIQELFLGKASSVFKQEIHAPADDREHRAARGRRGGAERDRRQQRENEAFRALLRQAAKELRVLETEKPSQMIFTAGPRDHHRELERHLHPDAARRLMVLGTPGPATLLDALRNLEALGEARVSAQVLEFQEARALGKAALGPNDVLQAVWSGRADRVYLDEYDPLPGVVCIGCGVHHPKLERRCPYCQEEVALTSIAQEIVAYARSHPRAPGLTFVGSGAGWLRNLGGMAALLRPAGKKIRKLSERLASRS